MVLTSIIIAAVVIVILSANLRLLDTTKKKGLCLFIGALCIIAVLTMLQVVLIYRSQQLTRRVTEGSSRYIVWHDEMGNLQRDIHRTWDALDTQMAVAQPHFPRPDWTDEQMLEGSELATALLINIAAVYNSQLYIAERCNGPDVVVDHSQTGDALDRIQDELRAARDSQNANRIRATTASAFLEVTHLVLRCRTVPEQCIDAYMEEEYKSFFEDPADWQPRVDPKELKE